MSAKSNFLSNAITSIGSKAIYDAACKRLLANKEILARLMKACLPEYENEELSTIMNTYLSSLPEVGSVPLHPDEKSYIQLSDTTDTTVHEGVIRYDLKYYAKVPNTVNTQMIIDIEAQKQYYPIATMYRRSFYYNGRLTSSQYGTDFENENYRDLKKVVSIWIFSQPPKHLQNKIVRVGPKMEMVEGEAQLDPRLLDLSTIVYVYLGNKENEGTGILKLLEVLLSPSRDAEEKLFILEHEFGIPMTHEIESGVSEMCNLSEVVWEEGLNEGIAKGSELTKLNDIQSLMKKLGWSIEQAMDVLDIPNDEKETYVQKLTVA